jgi:hypothetical protein
VESIPFQWHHTHNRLFRVQMHKWRHLAFVYMENLCSECKQLGKFIANFLSFMCIRVALVIDDVKNFKISISLVYLYFIYKCENFHMKWSRSMWKTFTRVCERKSMRIFLYIFEVSCARRKLFFPVNNTTRSWQKSNILCVYNSLWDK